MEYSDLIAARYSVRAYRPDPVEDHKLQAVLEAARLAPTAANRQPIHLVVMRTHGRQAEIAQIYRRPWFSQAPLLIAVCAISSQAWVRESDCFNARLIDAAIGALSPPLREVLLLREFEEMDYAQIARTVGIPIGTVMSRLARAREKLRLALAPSRQER